MLVSELNRCNICLGGLSLWRLSLGLSLGLGLGLGLGLRLCCHLLLLLHGLLLGTAFDLLNLLVDEHDALLKPLCVLVCCSKGLSCFHHKLLRRCQIDLNISCVALWSGHTSLNIRFDRLLLELEGLFSEFKEFKLILLSISLALETHKVEVLDLILDALHADHAVRVVILLLQLYRVIRGYRPSSISHQSIRFILALSRCLRGDLLWRLLLLSLSRSWLVCSGVHQEVLFEILLNLLHRLEMFQSRLLVTRLLELQRLDLLLLDLLLELLGTLSRIWRLDAKLAVKRS